MFTVRRRRKERKEKMKTNVSGLNVWTADGEEDGGRGTLGKRQSKIKQRERERFAEHETEILFLYQQNLKESECDPSDAADHPIGGGNLPKKEKCRVEVSFLVPDKYQTSTVATITCMYVCVCVCVYV